MGLTPGSGGGARPASGGGVARAAALSLLAALGACATPGPRGVTGRPPPTINREWLLGGWVLQGQNCDSDAGVLYRSDGTWASYGAAGTWRLDRNRLALSIAGSRHAKPRPPETYVEEIEVQGADRFVAHRQGIPDRRFVRCRAGRPRRG